MSQKTRWWVGDVWQPEVLPEDPRTKTPVDPATLTCTVRKPDGTSSTVSVTKLSTGHYTASIPLTTAGSWAATFQSTTGSYQGVESIQVSVFHAPPD